MEELTTVARPYALAVFERARESNRVTQWTEMLGFLGALLSDAQMRAAAGDPRVPRARLEQLIFDLAGERLDVEGRNLLRVVLDAGRIQAVPAIARVFESLRAEAEGVLDVEVVSAFALEPAEEQSLIDAVQRRVGKRLRVRTRTDRELIGGAVVRVGDLVIDLSLQGRLRQLAKQFG